MTDHVKKTGTTYRFTEWHQERLTKLLTQAQGQRMARLTENDYLMTLIANEWNRILVAAGLPEERPS